MRLHDLRALGEILAVIVIALLPIAFLLGLVLVSMHVAEEDAHRRCNDRTQQLLEDQ